MHGTFNLREILKDQKIRHDFGSIMPGDKHFLFTQLLFKGTKYDSVMFPTYCGYYTIIMGRDILKEYPYSIYNGLGKLDYTCDVPDKKADFKSKGNRKRMPNLKPIKEMINKSVISYRNMFSGINRRRSFSWSHEIIFNKDIPINNKYIKCIICQESHDEPDIKELCKKLGIVIKYISDDYKLNTITEMLKIVES